MNFDYIINPMKMKSLPFKVGGLKKKSAALAITIKVCASVFGLGSSLPGFESFSKFDGQ